MKVIHLINQWFWGVVCQALVHTRIYNTSDVTLKATLNLSQGHRKVALSASYGRCVKNAVDAVCARVRECGQSAAGTNGANWGVSVGCETSHLRNARSPSHWTHTEIAGNYLEVALTDQMKPSYTT